MCPTLARKLSSQWICGSEVGVKHGRAEWKDRAERRPTNLSAGISRANEQATARRGDVQSFAELTEEGAIQVSHWHGTRIRSTERSTRLT